MPDNIDFVMKPLGTPDTEKLLLMLIDFTRTMNLVITDRNIDTVLSSKTEQACIKGYV